METNLSEKEKDKLLGVFAGTLIGAFVIASIMVAFHHNGGRLPGIFVDKIKLTYETAFLWAVLFPHFLSAIIFGFYLLLGAEKELDGKTRREQCIEMYFWVWCIWEAVILVFSVVE